MKLSTEANIISVENKSFENKEGSTIDFRQAVIVVDGEVFTTTVDKGADLKREEGKGTATLDISERNGKIKIRLLAFGD